MKIEILDAASNEEDEAFFYYERINPALVEDLQAEMEHYVSYISQSPEVPPLHRKIYRRVNLRRFPYYFAYLIHDDTIWILTFAHVSRQPEYWFSRVKRFFR